MGWGSPRWMPPHKAAGCPSKALERRRNRRAASGRFSSARGGAGLQAVWSRNKPNRTRTECWGQRGSLTAGAGRGRPHMPRGREAEERRAGKMTPATPRAPASIACGCTCPGGAQRAGGGGEDQPRALRGLHRPRDGGSAHPSAAAAGVGLGGPSGRPREPA